MIHRPRLFDALEKNVPLYKLTLIAAAAGYGKTTLLAEWADSSSFPVAWLSITEEDDVAHFFQYLLTAWENVQPKVAESSLGLLLGSQSPDVSDVLSAFINTAHDVEDHFVFILDDYHLVTDSTIHDALTFILDYLPQQVHFVISSRTDPPLPLARYRAHGQLLEYWVNDLRFSRDETEAFLSQTVGFTLPSDDIASLCGEVEGWVTGLQLMALTWQRHHELPGSVPAASGRSRFIADYLAQDVLKQLSPDMRTFLLKTSVLDRLCGPLCEAVAGVDSGQEMLETAEREHLFLVPLDDSRQWFRYHPIFADFLRGELTREHSDQVALIHSRAAAWYSANNLPDQAFHHAVKGEDWQAVADIVEHYALFKFLRRELRTLQRWVEAIPEEWYASSPLLSIFRANFLFFVRSFDACYRCLDEVEGKLVHSETDENRRLIARASVIRCGIACVQSDVERVEVFADRALQELSAEDFFFRVLTHHMLGDTYRACGRWEQSRDNYLKALELVQPPFRFYTVHLLGSLADLSLRQGRLRQAAGYWEEALGVIQERASRGSLPLPLTGWVYIRMGELLYEWNQLPEAEERLSQGMERVELGGDVEAMIAGCLIAGRLKLTQGDIEAAAGYLEQARSLLEGAQFSDWTGAFQRFQLEVWLAQDRLRAAVEWADVMLRANVIEEQAESGMAQLAVARVLTVKGDRHSLEEALLLLGRVLEAAEEEGRAGISIEALTLQALAYWRLDGHTRAMASLERALRLAEPEGYVRLFADLGPAMGQLLQQASSLGVLRAYVEKLLAAFNLPFPVLTDANIPEVLTSREQEILTLIASGLTNREIGEQLVISPQTVKKHTGNIYGKLGVNNRTEAAVKARELNLLD